MTHPIEIIDRGRGPQLSTSRITVQDVVPYLQRQCTYEQIREVMPVLTVDEYQTIERYVHEHYQEVMAQDRRIRERAAARGKSAEEDAAERRERLMRLEQARELILRGKQEANGGLPSR